MAKKMYVGNLPYSFTSAELSELFKQFGAVTSAEVMIDRITGQSRGFGFVAMDDPEAANKAMSQLDGQLVNGRPLKVNEAREREARPAGGGGGPRGPAPAQHRAGGGRPPARKDWSKGDRGERKLHHGGKPGRKQKDEWDDGGDEE
jgi:RNA recognition motif-containing protein